MSTLHEEMKSRCERILAGERNNDDFYRIIMWARARSDGTIRDLGDFLAHFDERKKGDSTEEMIDYFLSIRLKLMSFDKEKSAKEGKSYFSFDKMPKDFAVGLKASLRTIGLERLSKNSGIPAFRIPMLMGNIINKAQIKLDGGRTLYNRCDEEEHLLLQSIIGNDDIRSLYKLDEVFDDFVDLLFRFNLIKKGDNRINSFKTYFGTFICKSLDKCVLNRSGIKAKLFAWVSKEGELRVMAEAKIIKTKSGGSITHTAPFFWTEIKASDIMSSDVKKTLSELGKKHPSLEILPNGNLKFI